MGTDKNAAWLQDRREEITNADYSDACRQSILDFLNAYNPDVLRLKPPIIMGRDQREDTLATSTRLRYASTLHRTSTWTELTECSADDLNRIAEQRLNGKHHSVDSDGIGQNTVHQDGIIWRSYARFHQNHPEGYEIDIDPEEIILVGREDTSVDERDMFDAEEIEAMRTACTNKRDRALLELLIYTGQRHAALRWLTVNDVQPDEGDSGMLYIPDHEGMKGATGKRPLLGAQKAVREWKQSHPTGNPDDAFITHIYDWSGREEIDPGDHLSTNSFGQITKQIADRADVEKPANPHQFRHYFVTMAVSKHGMSFDTVRHLIGHAAGSRELERTYQHLVDEDYIENAELDMGIREEREESLTPPQCFTCNEPLDPSNNFCPNCGHTYSPQAAELEEDVESAKAEGALAATDAETQQNVQILMDLLEDDEKLRQLQTLYEESDAESLQALADSLR